MAKLLSSLPIGASIKFGKHSVGSEVAQPIIWVVADKNHIGYPDGSVTLLAKQVIDLRAFDGVENDDGGNKEYAYSNIHQWINSSAGAGAWYTPAHAGDRPPSAQYTTDTTEYYTRAGFLYNFDPKERDAILSTSISGLASKVFIPSTIEMGILATGDGVLLAYASEYGARSTLTNQAFTNSLATNKPYGYCQYWCRNSAYNNTYPYVVNVGGKYGASPAATGNVGVRPLLNVSGDLGISDTTDSEDCYTFSLTNAPSAPTYLQFLTSKIYTTKPCSISWGASIDPNGDTFTYKVHLYYDGVEWGTPIDVGTALNYTLPSVKSGVSTIGFGVEAVDSKGHSSGIVSITSAAHTNYAPVISGSNGDLGINPYDDGITPYGGFEVTYEVRDTDNTTVTVKEYIDNVEIRSYVATLGDTNTFSVKGNTWLKLANGIHTLKIVATDGVDETTRVISFTKKVNTLVVQRNTPIASATKPTRLVVTVVKNIPPEASFKVEACNNGFDGDAVVWEDITSSISRGQVHVFSNTVKTAGNWGVNIRVTVDRNGSEGACYITEIGGNFE